MLAYSSCAFLFLYANKRPGQAEEARWRNLRQLGRFLNLGIHLSWRTVRHIQHI